MTLSRAIRAHALAAAQAGNWQSVAEILHAITVTAEPRKCGSKESAIAVIAAGGNPAALLELLRADAVGNLLYARLADGSSEGGVIWAEPLITIPYLRLRESDFGSAVVNALINLSAPVTRPFAATTALLCRMAWESEIAANWWTAQSAVIHDRLITGSLSNREAIVAALQESL